MNSAPRQSAGAREWLEEIARACAEFDGTTLPSWREYVKDRIAPLIAQQTAAKDAEIERLTQDCGGFARQLDQKTSEWASEQTKRIAAERERDSLLEEKARLRRMIEGLRDENAALKAGKDGQQ